MNMQIRQPGYYRWVYCAVSAVSSDAAEYGDQVHTTCVHFCHLLRACHPFYVDVAYGCMYFHA